MSKEQPTSNGIPIVHMWGCPMPQPGVSGAGYPVLVQAEHRCICEATREDGAYNHHPQIAWHAGRFHAALARPEHLPAWDFEGRHGYPNAAEDGHRLCEPTVYRASEGCWMMLLRDCIYSHRMYVSKRDEKTGAWLPAHPTDIPDSPVYPVPCKCRRVQSFWLATRWLLPSTIRMSIATTIAIR